MNGAFLCGSALRVEFKVGSVLQNWQLMQCPTTELGCAAALSICCPCCMCLKYAAAVMNGCRCVPAVLCIGKSCCSWCRLLAGDIKLACQNKSCLATTAQQYTARDRCLACVRASTAIQLLQEEMGSPLPQGGEVSGVDAWCPPGAGAEAAGPLLAMPHMTSVLAPLALGSLLSISCPKIVVLARVAARQNDMLALLYMQAGLSEAASCCAAQTANQRHCCSQAARHVQVLLRHLCVASGFQHWGLCQHHVHNLTSHLMLSYISCDQLSYV